MKSARKARRQAHEAIDDLVASTRGGAPLRTQLARLALTCTNLVLFVLGLSFTAAAGSILAFAEQFYGNETFQTQALRGLQVAIAVGVFLMILSVFGCFVLCKPWLPALAAYAGTLTVVIILQLVAGGLIIAFGDSIAALKIGNSARSIQDIELEAIYSFMNATFDECCLGVLPGESSAGAGGQDPDWHCQQTIRLAGGCYDNSRQRFIKGLQSGMTGLIQPIAIAMICFAMAQLYLWCTSIYVLVKIYRLEMGKGNYGSVPSIDDDDDDDVEIMRLDDDDSSMRARVV